MKKDLLIKLISGALSITVSFLSSLYLIYLDFQRSIFHDVWDYQFIAMYVLISALLFAILNLFRQIENIINRENGETSISNLSGIYAYIFGTFIYVVCFQFLFDNDLKSYGLVIPIGLATIGFNIRLLRDPKETAIKKGLIITNLLLLFCWSLITFYLYNDLAYKKYIFYSTQEKFEQLDSKYLKRADSLANVFIRGVDFELLKRLKNDTLEQILYEEVKLIREFSKYREVDEYVSSLRANYMYNYGQIRLALALGLLTVVLLNVIYLIYLRR